MILDASVSAQIAKGLPAAHNDIGEDHSPLRCGTYRELCRLNLVPTKHSLAEEGSYFVANNGQATTVTGNNNATFSNTTGVVSFYNADPPGGRRISLDYITLVVRNITPNGTLLKFMAAVDGIQRYSTGGSVDLAPLVVSPNMARVDRSAIIRRLVCGPHTLKAPSPAERIISAARLFDTANLTDGGTVTFQFGGADTPFSTNVYTGGTTIFAVINMPPAIIGPGQSFVLYQWLNSGALNCVFQPEIGWWER